MTEPKDELLAALRVARSEKEEQRIRELEQATAFAIEADKIAEQQRLVDQKILSDRQKSNDYARAYVEIMRDNNVPPVRVFNPKTTFIEAKLEHNGMSIASGYSHYSWIPTYKTTYTEVGIGWIISVNDSPTSPVGHVILENLQTYFFRPIWKEDGTSAFTPIDRAVALMQNYKSPNRGEEKNGGSYTDGTPLESPYASEDGRTMLINSLERLGIVTDTTIEELPQ